MVSRRKILSRSRDDLTTDTSFHPPEEEEDVWYQKEKLCKDHIQEVLDKWTQIDDEIWAKVIVLEKNRRVAKAYARTPVLTVNGSDDGFDGFRIGLSGFENPMRDQETEDIRKHIGHGVKVKMDEAGNILIKRISKCNVFIKNMCQDEENSIGNEILRLPGGALEPDKPFKLFDMKKFQSNVNRELRRAYPYRRRLECQCLSAIAFVKSQAEPLDCPIWVLIINVVAMDMLKSKLPPVQRIVDIKNRPRIPVPDEDPYSVAGNGTESLNSFSFAAAKEHLIQSQAQRRSDKPPKLPPRENLYPHAIPKPDYDDADETASKISSRSKDKSNKNKKYDDPYYCGMRARVPNFVSKSKGKEAISAAISAKRLSVVLPQPLTAMVLPPQHQYHLREHQQLQQQQHFQQLAHQHPQQAMWHSYNHKVYPVGPASESPYSKINGQPAIPTRNYIPSQNRPMFIGEWD